MSSSNLKFEKCTGTVSPPDWREIPKANLAGFSKIIYFTEHLRSTTSSVFFMLFTAKANWPWQRWGKPDFYEMQNNGREGGLYF
jgi:hypothetical protein